MLSDPHPVKAAIVTKHLFNVLFRFEHAQVQIELNHVPAIAHRRSVVIDSTGIVLFKMLAVAGLLINHIEKMADGSAASATFFTGK